MIIGALQKLSLLDYEGKVSAIIFTQGCNFRCHYCYNPNLVPLQETDFSLSTFFEFLEKRKGMLEGVVITGGEPTIHNDLPEFIKKIKSFGYCVKLDTNGTRPEMLKQLIEKKLIDYVAMDIKAPLDRYKDVIGLTPEAGKIKESVSLIISSGIDHEFRTTVMPGLTKDDFIEISKTIKGAKRYYLQQFIPTKTLNKDFESRLPYPESTLNEFKTAVEERVKFCKIRNI